MYLGDGLYAKDEGFQFRVYTDRMGVVHEVYFEDTVLQSFFKFIEASRGVKITVEKIATLDKALKETPQEFADNFCEEG